MRRFILFILDTALLYGALFAMILVRYDSQFGFHYHLHLAPFTIIFAFWLITFFVAGLYDQRMLRNGLGFYSRLLEAIVASTAISISLFYLAPGFFGITPKLNLATFIVIFTLAEFGVRSIFNATVEKRFQKHVLIVAENEQAEELASLIRNNPQLGYTLDAVVGPNDMARIESAVRGSKLDTIVVSPEAYHLPGTIDIFYKALGRKINFYSLTTFYERLTGRVPLGVIDQIWFLENLTEGSRNAYEVLKRFGDILFGVIFGTLSLILYPFIIIAMQIDSPGPVFYRQTRLGRLGKPFQLVKFRNMIPDAEKMTGAVWAGDNDPRITRVGKFLRKTRLDEIPQFWAIVKGDMSLVGPRAERPEFHDLLKKEVPFYEERYLIKPGLSGWAQINYHYGASVADAAEKLKYDLYYIKNRSFLLDVGIVLKTIRTALSQAGK